MLTRPCKNLSNYDKMVCHGLSGVSPISQPIQPCAHLRSGNVFYRRDTEAFHGPALCHAVSSHSVWRQPRFLILPPLVCHFFEVGAAFSPLLVSHHLLYYFPFRLSPKSDALAVDGNFLLVQAVRPLIDFLLRQPKNLLVMHFTKPTQRGYNNRVGRIILQG